MRVLGKGMVLKKLIIEVREDFVVPDIFSEEDPQALILSLREIALNIGAQAVSGISQVKPQATDTSNSREEALLLRIAALEQQSEAARQDIEAHTKKIYEENQREALLSQRECFATEKEALTVKLENKHASILALLEKRHSERIQEQKQSFEQLRTEHEGLVLKLMTRLEATPARTGMNAPTLGRTFEENVEKHLRQAFGARSGFHLEDVHASGHRGDLLMIFDGLRIMIELKSYDPKTRVPSKEVEKLARDLSEVQPRCDAAIMISACSEITGHYSCGPLEVSTAVACVPVLFINNFLSLGEPQVTLHMTRVFLSMVQIVKPERMPEDYSESSQLEKLRMANEECARRCTGYLLELNRQSADILRQATSMKNAAIKLRETVIVMIENEVSRFGGLIQLMTHGVRAEEAVTIDVLPDLDDTVFTDPASMSPDLRDLASRITTTFMVGNHQQRCSTKDLLDFIHTNLNVKTQKAARDALKAIFLDEVVKHGYVVGIAKRASVEG